MHVLRAYLEQAVADVKLDMDRTWLKFTTIGLLLGIAITGTMLYADLKSAVGTIQKTIERDATLHEKDRSQIVASVDAANATIREVRDELRKLVSENVSLRQSAAWLELFQVTVQAWTDKMRSENPSLKISDLKVPALPR